MILKRPSFRRGGNAGIGSITPRVNARFGFGFLRKGMGGDKLFPQKIGTTPSAGGTGVEGIIGQGMMETLISGGSRFKPPVVAAPLYGKIAAVTAPIAAVGGLAYLNRPRTLAAKKFMQEFGPLDETLSGEDLQAYYEEIDRLNKIGDEISFTDAIFMNPDTGTYPKMFGRTEDRDTRRKLELQEREEAKVVDDDIESIGEGPGEALPATGNLNIMDRVLAEANKRAQKRADDKKRAADIKANPLSDKRVTKEKSFENRYEEERKKIEKLIGKSDDTTKGEIALALSEAIGTEGTIADKASTLNKFLLGKIAKDKKSKKDIALLAYATVSDLDKAKISAGKRSQTGQLIDRVTELEGKKNLSDAEKTELKISRAALGADKPLDFKKIKPVTDNLIKNISRYKEETVTEERAKLKNKIFTDVALLREGNVTDSIILLAFGDDIGLFPELTGRTTRAMGSPKEGETVKESVMITEEAPAAPVQKLTYNELRNRLPKEITDDVVALISNSEQALQDFAYIRTQGDVDSFNVKYGVNLVLPQTA